MASIQKVTAAGVNNWLRHNNRTIQNDKNTDIDPERSRQNYSLTPYINIPRDQQYDRRDEIRKSEYQHYKELKGQFYCLNRKDVNALISVVVTFPTEITDPETEDRFAQGVANFLTERYGNVISITVHKDEGKYHTIKDPEGNTLKEYREGRPHLHFTFIPTVPIKKSEGKKLRKSMEGYSEKISAKERINRIELLTLHPDMNRYLNDVCGIKCNMHSGITAAQGGNKTVAELKKEFDQKIIHDLTVENEALKERIKDITVEQQAKSIEQEQKRQGEITVKDNIISQQNIKIAALTAQLATAEQNQFTTSAVIANKNLEITELKDNINQLRSQIKTIEQTKNAEIEALRTQNEELIAKTKDMEVTTDRQESWGANQWGSQSWGRTNAWGHTVDQSGGKPWKNPNLMN